MIEPGGFGASVASQLLFLSLIHADDRRRMIYLDFHVPRALAVSSSIYLYPHARARQSRRLRTPELRGVSEGIEILLWALVVALI